MKIFNLFFFLSERKEFTCILYYVILLFVTYIHVHIILQLERQIYSCSSTWTRYLVTRCHSRDTLDEISRAPVKSHASNLVQGVAWTSGCKISRLRI